PGTGFAHRTLGTVSRPSGLRCPHPEAKRASQHPVSANVASISAAGLVSAGGGPGRRRLRQQSQSAVGGAEKLVLCLLLAAQLEVGRWPASEVARTAFAQSALSQSRFLYTRTAPPRLLGLPSPRAAECARGRHGLTLKKTA